MKVEYKGETADMADGDFEMVLTLARSVTNSPAMRNIVGLGSGDRAAKVMAALQDLESNLGLDLDQRVLALAAKVSA